MSKFTFTKAVKYGSMLRMALIGTSGSGKTYSALSIATHLGERIAFIDTERGSARKYSDQFDFDVLEFESFAVENFIDAINEAERAGYDVLIIDSLSHAWTGKDGVLEFVDLETAKSKSKNAYTSGWRSATPLHNKLVDTILGCSMHVICCMRSKTEYVMQSNDRGKTMPVKIGMQPIQRDGMEYEFDVIGDMDIDHNLIVGKTRCREIDGKLFPFPGKNIADVLRVWLSGDVAPAEVAQARVGTPTSNISQSNPPQSTNHAVNAPASAPASAPAAAIAEPTLSDGAMVAYKRLKSLFVWMNKCGILGFDNNDYVREQIKAIFGVDNLRLVTDEHQELMESMLIQLKRQISNTDTPFETPPPDFLQDIVIDPAPLPAVEQSPVPDPVPDPTAGPNIDYDAVLAQIDAELNARKIPDAIKNSLASTAMSLAEGKQPAITSILLTVKSYPLLDVPVDDAVKNLQNEAKRIIQLLVQGNVDGFQASKRLNASLSKHLGGAKTVNACKDVAMLSDYIVHLHGILNGTNKENEEVAS